MFARIYLTNSFSLMNPSKISFLREAFSIRYYALVRQSKLASNISRSFKFIIVVAKFATNSLSPLTTSLKVIFFKLFRQAND